MVDRYWDYSICDNLLTILHPDGRRNAISVNHKLIEEFTRGLPDESDVFDTYLSTWFNRLLVEQHKHYRIGTLVDFICPSL